MEIKAQKMSSFNKEPEDFNAGILVAQEYQSGFRHRKQNPLLCVKQKFCKLRNLVLTEWVMEIAGEEGSRLGHQNLSLCCSQDGGESKPSTRALQIESPPPKLQA